MKIKVPTDINDITLEQYQKFHEINKEETDADFLMFKTIEIFCGVDVKIASQFPLKDAEEIGSEIGAILEQNKSFEHRFVMNGVEYGFIPDMEAMTIGEYIDLEDGLKDVKTFNKAAAVMYRPIKKKFGELYTIEPYTAQSSMIQTMKDMPLGVISAAIVFFYNIVTDLSRVSRAYSSSMQETAMTTLVKLNSQKNTDGLTAFMRLAVEGLSTIKQQQK